MYENKIVHRDISMHNILLGEPGAEPGGRGMLAGLDMAIFTDSDRDIPETNENGRSVSSLTVLPLHLFCHTNLS